jgi:hypothetical protein
MEGWNASDGDSYVSKYKVMGKIGHGAFSEVMFVAKLSNKWFSML